MAERMRKLLTDTRLLIVGALLLCLVGLAGPATAAQHNPDQKQLNRFLWGLAGQESGWNYYARNPSSGAFGRYQIMPENWTSWAHRYVGRGWIDQSPLNQERVVRDKINALHRWLGGWKRVAYWWFTGDTDPVVAHWSSTAKRYVANVMSLMVRAPKNPIDMPVEPANRNHPIDAGDWRLLTRNVSVRSSFASGHHYRGHLKAGPVLEVRGAQYGPSGRLLWLKVILPSGRVGWISARATVPAKPQKSQQPPELKPDKT
ncbi:MAG: hypothetical protein QOH61_247 [Chloroflexota bacterium]|jgi:hypothetical protein|nr:hypothetical protein [Chloroflexota bacterium]